ncbi:MAG: hypothetical protein ACKPA8_13955 [Dolichospermum sp.]
MVINSSANQRFELKQTIDEVEKRLSQVNSQIAQINAEKIAKQESLRKQIVKHTKNIHTWPIQIIPIRNKKQFLAIVFTTLLIISYDSTIIQVNSMINIEASSQTTTMVERQIPAEVINNSKLTWLEQIGKELERGTIRSNKINELYPEIREKVNSELGFQIWARVVPINFMLISLLTFIEFISHSYTIRLKIHTIKSKIFNALNFVIFITVMITMGLTIKIQISFPESLFQSLFYCGVTTGIILVIFSYLPWFSQLREILSDSQEIQTIFSQKKEYLLFSFIVISGIALGVSLSLLLQNIATIIFLNGMALAAFIMLFKHLYDEIPKDSLYYDWKSRFNRW